MPTDIPQPTTDVHRALLDGMVIPAHPLALTSDRKLDEQRQRALTRYYLSAGAGGLAVAVHTTQFAIRQPQYNLLGTVLELAKEVATDEFGPRKPVMIAGICGETVQAQNEAELAAGLGYHAGLLSLAALPNASDEELLVHVSRIAERIPLIGFYLQPSVGGRILSFDFWRRFAEIPNVIAIKVAPFNRYHTLDVMRAVGHSSRAEQIAMLTGNDDAIVMDLLAEYQFSLDGKSASLRFCGGLLGHWACWTQAAVQLFEQIRTARSAGYSTDSMRELLVLANQVTDMNAAIFDAANNYRGCIAGIHEVLRRQGLLAGTWCLDPTEQLSPGQADEISRVCRSYPHLTDDAFVQENLSAWLRA